MELVLQRAGLQARGQHASTPPPAYSETPTHKPSTYNNSKRITRLRQPRSEKDNQAEPDRSDELERTTTATRDSNLHTASHNTLDEDLSPP